MEPRIRLVVVNYNGGDMTIRCLQHLRGCRWPEDRLEIVLVDNASSDDVVARTRRELPSVRVIENAANLGFAGGANAGMRDLGDTDYVGLVNNDAFPDPDWLHPLVGALETAPDIGAASPKILLAKRFLAISVSSATFRPGIHDSRELGVMVFGVRLHGEDRFASAVFHDGFLGPEHGQNGPFQWTTGHAELWIPLQFDEAVPASVELKISSSVDMRATIATASTTSEIEVTGVPTWFELPIEGQPFDVINNAGVRLVEGGWAGDRGFLEIDSGQYDERVEVFGWCGAAVLMRAEYLEDVGLFDEDLFLYYEDTDLSWRGRLRGWRYLYEPTSVVRHVHSATTQEGSPLFRHFVDRNRLLVFLKNAPASAVVDALRRYAAETAVIFVRDVVRPTIVRGPRATITTRQKLRSAGGFARRAPGVIASRIRDRRSLQVDRATVASWAVPH